jgi:hypothetical protein
LRPQEAWRHYRLMIYAPFDKALDPAQESGTSMAQLTPSVS